ncbi:MAG: type II toxin-antitoxin system RelE/ParE family toxin, partial [Endomicrobium sp.]|nr:type II toxin-antitoxin system RelE/ParE family toxin [Endomicrobium sp.]
MAYKISFEENAAEIFAELDKSVQKRIVRFLEKDSILENPKSSGKPLTGYLKGLWRYRVGDYRIITEIKDKEFIILI